MTVRHAWLGCALVVLAAGHAACTSIEHCKRGEVGCAAGPTDDAGTCRFDLVPQGGRCITPAEAALSGEGGPNRPQPNPCGTCAAGRTCTTDQKSCVDFCEAPEVLPGSMPAPEPIRCGGELKDTQTGEVYKLTFEETCVSDCQLACRLRDWFCKTPCDKAACEQPAVLTACHTRCDAASDPLSCIQGVCNDTRAGGCTNTEGFCQDGEFPDCSPSQCTNSCATTAYDGVCDDGDLYSAAFASCAWGTDCSDCGPRAGEDTTRKRPQGELCSLPEQCAGYASDFAKNAAFCAPVSPDQAFKRCVLDCSGKGELCPVGTTCTTLVAADSAGGTRPVTDVNDVEARGCLPDACR